MKLECFIRQVPMSKKCQPVLFGRHWPISPQPKYDMNSQMSRTLVTQQKKSKSMVIVTYIVIPWVTLLTESVFVQNYQFLGKFNKIYFYFLRKTY